jgi:hypothetical protein
VSKPIQPLALDSIGIYGLNKQSSPSSLDPRWLIEANNIMLDDEGRVTSRRGIKQISDLIGSSTSNDYIIKSLGEFRSATGSSTIFAGSNDKIYKLNKSNSPFTLDAQTFTGTPQTITDGNWEFCNFNNKFYGVQPDHKPIYFDGTNWMDLEDASGFSAPGSVITFNPSSCVGAFGRLWVGGTSEANDVVYYSDTLIGHDFTGGLAGYIDLKSVWDGDKVVALSSFMGKLVIFGSRNIVVYNSPSDPSVDAFQLDEVIRDIGCVARDTVQALGDDIVFLSNSGVRSLQRTMVKDKMPLTDLSVNIKDEMVRHITNADMSQAKGQYCLCGGYYVVSFPDRNIAYVFDFKGSAGAAPKVSNWNFDSKKTPKSFLSTDEGIMYVGLGAPEYEGRIAVYDGYFDVEKQDVTATYGTSSACIAAGNIWESTGSNCWKNVNNTYQADFSTVWLDFGDPSRAKLLKRFLAVISGGQDMAVTMNWYRDYEINAESSSFTIPGPVSSFTWGHSSSIWGVATYAGTAKPVEYKSSLARSAKVLRMEMRGTIKGYKASLQNMIIWAKQGKIR